MKIDKYRIPSIEILRVISIFGVICIHTNPFLSLNEYKTIFYIIDGICRAVVPVFFIISGYIFGKSLEKSGSLQRTFWAYFKRLFILYIAWVLIYRLLPPAIIKLGIVAVRNHSYSEFIYQETSKLTAALKLAYMNPFEFFRFWHLWFLAVLMIGVSCLCVFIYLKKERYVIPFFLIVLVVGKFIHQTLEGDFGSNILSYKNGIFFGPIFIALGWWFYNKKIKPNVSFAFALTLLGFSLQTLELAVLYFLKMVNITAYQSDYLLGTIPFAIGIFMLALAVPGFGENSRFAKIGKLVVGIYLVHIFVMQNIDFNFLHTLFGPVIWQIFFPFAVFFCSIGLTVLLRRYRITRWLII